MANTSAKSVTDIPDRLLTVDEVARMLNFNPRTVREKAKRGEIPFIRLRRDIRFRPDTIRKLLEPGKLEHEPPNSEAFTQSPLHPGLAKRGAIS